jgi:DivIVA domain-containing protein
MDLTADIVREAQFRQAWKGYDTAEVDDFLDEIAVGIEELQHRHGDVTNRLQLAEERAARAESRPSLRSEPDESVRRTLVLAQRAADLVVSEAKAVSDRIVSDAREQAARMISSAQLEVLRTENDASLRADHVLSEATAKADHVLSDAESNASRLTAIRAAELQSSLAGLVEEQTRRRLELERLSVGIEQTKAQFRNLLGTQMAELEAISVPETHQAPQTGGREPVAFGRGASDSDGENVEPKENIEAEVEAVLARVADGN